MGDDELALRAHVRAQLHDYMNEHINIDHLAYTEHLVTQFLSETLHTVPLFDSTTLALPEDPLTSLLRQYAIGSASSYIPTEKLEVTREAKVFLMECNKKMRCVGNPPSTRSMLCEDAVDFELPRPMSPILTRRAYQATREKLHGSANSSSFAHAKNANGILDAVEKLKLTLVDSLDSEEEHKNGLQSILGAKLQLSSNEGRDVRKMIINTPKNSSTASCSDAKNRLSRSAQNFLFDDEPLEEKIRPMSPPLFPRRQTLSTSSDAVSRSKMDKSSLASFVRAVGPPISTKEDDTIDFAKESMAIIDGWTTYLPEDVTALLTTSKPPSLNDGSSSDVEDQLDELMWNASTHPEALQDPSIEIASYKMDDFEIPRVLRPGFGIPLPSSLPNPMVDIESLQEMLLPAPYVDFGSKYHRVDNLDPPVSPSLIGQPPTEIDTVDPKDVFVPLDHSDDFDSAMQSMYRPLGGASSNSIIFDAKVHPTEQMLFEVPRLPEPNVHSPLKLRLPTDFRSLLAASKKKTQSGVVAADAAGDVDQYRGSVSLAKVSGLSSLNIELSWRPIVSGTSIPTQDELCGVVATSNNPGGDLVEQFEHSVKSWSPAILHFDDSSDLPLASLPRNEGLILTRSERRLVQGDVEPAHSSAMAVDRQQSDRETFYPASDASENIHRQSSYTPLPMTSQKRKSTALDSLEHLHPSKQRRLIPNEPQSALHQTSQSSYLASPHAENYHSNSTGAHNVQFTHPSPIPSDNAPQYEPGAIHTPRLDNSPLFHPSPEVLNAPSAATNGRFTDLVYSSVSHFRQLQGQEVLDLSNEPLNKQPTFNSPPDSPQPGPTQMPALDSISLHLPSTWEPPPDKHRYLASVALIQKRGLASALSSSSLGNIDLLEPTILQGDAPDLVLDPQHAIIFISLSQLPSISKELIARLKRLLPCYDNILTIFEGYTPARSNIPLTKNALLRKGGNGGLEVDVFSPPVILALKRFRRELAIEKELMREGDDDGVEVEQRNMELVCALSPSEAAMYARTWGDKVEKEGRERGNGKALWDGRSWLEGEDEDAVDLAKFAGMNIFAAAFILSRVSPPEFLEMDPLARTEYLGPLIGYQRIKQVNEELQLRSTQSYIESEVGNDIDETLHMGGDASSTTATYDYGLPDNPEVQEKDAVMEYGHTY